MEIARGGMTAGQLLARLATDPQYQAMRNARDRELSELAQQRLREQLPLLKQLAALDIVVDWVGRLLEMSNLDERIYPVLLDHLRKPYSPWLLEWIGRAFGRKAARPIVWNTLVSLIKTHALEVSAAEGVMAAISEMAQPGDADTLIELLSDRSLGPSRVYLVSNLMRSKKQEARFALMRHQIDPDLTKEITARLSRKRK